MQNSSRWPLCPTFRYGVKGQKIWIISNNVKLQIVQGQRLNINNGCVPVISDDSSLVSSFFLSFFFLATRFFSFTYFPTFDFDQTWSKWPVPWPLLRHRQWWGQRSRWGHWGQKGHFHQKGIKSYRILSIDAWLMHMHKLDPLYKSYGPKNSSGVIWGHGGQKIIFTKKASSPSEYVALTRYLCTCISLINSTKVMVLKIHPGSFGVTGVKRSFSLKML